MDAAISGTTGPSHHASDTPGAPTTFPNADRDQISRFVDALFKYADEGTFVSLRAFYDDANEVFEIRACDIAAGTTTLIDAAVAAANRAAQAARPVVFAPPIATFSNDRGAAERDLANGLSLSVECDRDAGLARTTLEALLGPATVVVASGGEWADPDTGVCEPKLHLHWRLTEPTRDADRHQALKLCRQRAMRLIGSDPTSNPIVHPMRWPGSWHRKGAPRLARIAGFTDREIDLDEASQRLAEALQAGDGGDGGRAEAGKKDEKPEKGEPRETAELVTAIITGADYHAPATALAMRFLKGGMPDAQVVLTLRGHFLAVPQAIRDIKDGVSHEDRWQARYDDIPRTVATARAKIDEEAARSSQADQFGPDAIQQFRLDAMTAGLPPRQAFLLPPLMPLGKVGLIFGPGGIGKSLIALDLCLQVALRGRLPEAQASRRMILGCQVPADAAGASVFLTLEDDAAEVHRRVATLDPQQQRRDAPCFVIPAVDLPDFDPTLVAAEGRKAALTAFAAEGLDRLLRTIAQASGCPIRLVILDPAGDFLNADENDASFVKVLMRLLRAVATRHGCTIILLGHVAKGIDVDSPTMRGSSAWIANSRFAYALTAPSAGDAERLAKEVNEPAESLVWGKLVKANHADAPVGVARLFVRGRAAGQVTDVTGRLASATPDEKTLLKLLVDACAESAAAGMPFAYSGVAGLWTQRADFPEPLARISKHRLAELGTKALKEGLLVKARTTHTQGAPKYLDAPNGPLARGEEVPMFQGSRAEAIERYRAQRSA